MHACMRVCMPACVYAGMSECLHAGMNAGTYARMNVHVCKYAGNPRYANMLACPHVCTFCM